MGTSDRDDFPSFDAADILSDYTDAPFKGAFVKVAPILLSQLLSTLTLGDVILKQRMRSSMENKQTESLSTVSIKGTRFRAEVEGTIEGKSQKTIILSDEKGTHSCTSINQTCIKLEGFSIFSPNFGGSDFRITRLLTKPTGKTQTVAGFSCTEYHVERDFNTMQSKEKNCYSKDAKAQLPLEFLKQGEKMVGSLAANPQVKKSLLGEFELGIPLKQSHNMSGSNSDIEVLSIQKAALSDTLFKLPTGYKIVELPKLKAFNPFSGKGSPGKNLPQEVLKALPPEVLKQLQGASQDE